MDYNYQQYFCESKKFKKKINSNKNVSNTNIKNPLMNLQISTIKQEEEKKTEKNEKIEKISSSKKNILNNLLSYQNADEINKFNPSGNQKENKILILQGEETSNSVSENNNSSITNKTKKDKEKKNKKKQDKKNNNHNGNGNNNNNNNNNSNNNNINSASINNNAVNTNENNNNMNFSSKSEKKIYDLSELDINKVKEYKPRHKNNLFSSNKEIMNLNDNNKNLKEIGVNADMTNPDKIFLSGFPSQDYFNNSMNNQNKI
jgi:hypothetical protein